MNIPRPPTEEDLVALERKHMGDPLKKHASDRGSEQRKAVEARNDAISLLPRDALDDKAAHQGVVLDVVALGHIEDPLERHAAYVAMGHNAVDQKAYRSQLLLLDSLTAEAVASALRRERQAIAAKKERKAGELHPSGVEQPLEKTSVALDQATLDRLQGKRARDSALAVAELGLNVVEPSNEQLRQQAARDEKSSIQSRPGGDNRVESDEVFTASKTDSRAVIPPEIEQRYRRDGNKYYEFDKPAAVAFEDKGNKLETRSSSEQIAESMVMIARARGWDEIKVAGTETFKKEVWLEAAAHGMHVRGYAPREQDKTELAKRSQTQADRVENETKPYRSTAPEQTKRSDARAEAFSQLPPVEGSAAYPELRGAYALAAAIDKQAQASGFTPEQRAIVAARAHKNIVNSIERGHFPTVDVREQGEVPLEKTHEATRELEL